MALLQPVTLAQVQAQVSFTLLNNPDGTGAFGGTVAPDQSSRTMSLKCAFVDHEKLIKLLAGLPVLSGSGAGATVTRALPCVYPWNPNLYVTRIGLRAAGSDSSVTIDRPWSSVILTVEFSTLPYDPKDTNNPFMAVNIRGASSLITQPNVQYSFVGNGEKIDADLGFPVSELTFEIRKFSLPNIDAFLTVAMPLLNKVNSDTVTISTTTFAAGYMMFPTFDLSVEQNALGTPQYAVTIPLQYRSLKWNQGIRSDGTVDTITPAPFSTAALSGLLA